MIETLTDANEESTKVHRRAGGPRGPSRLLGWVAGAPSTEHLVELLAHPDEGRPLAHLLELACTDVGAGRADSSEHIQHGHRDVPAVGHLHALTLTRPVLSHPASMLLHGDGRGHPVELLHLYPVLLYHLAAALVVTGQHAAHHHEVRAGPEGLGHIPGAGAAPVRDDVPAEPVGGVRALQHGGELRVAHARLLPRGAHRAGADADLDDVGTREDE